MICLIMSTLSFVFFSLTVQHLCIVEGNEVFSTSLNFFGLGDWGGLPISPYSTSVEKAVAKKMGETADRLEPSFVMAFGTLE